MDDIERQVDEAAAALAADRAAPVQMDLLAPGEMREARGAGRPAGARNRRTIETQRWFERTGTMPLQWLADVYRTDTLLLAAKLAIKPKEALAAQIAAATAVLPYVEQKLPLAIEDVSDKPRPVIVIGDVSQAQARQVDARVGLKVIAVKASEPAV